MYWKQSEGTSVSSAISYTVTVFFTVYLTLSTFIRLVLGILIKLAENIIGHLKGLR